MGKNSISGFVIALAIGALALAPHAAGGDAAQACPQSSGSGCEPVGARPSELPSRSKQQRPRALPRFAYDSNGQQVWRAGNHLMQ